MKICAFTDTYSPQKNGVVVFLNSLLPRLAKKHKVVLFAPGEEEFRTEQVSKNFKIYWMPAKPFPMYEGYRVATLDYAKIRDLLSEEKPDVVHCHAPMVLGIEGLLAAKRKNIPVVATYHTHLPDYIPHLLKGKFPSFLNAPTTYPVKKLIKLLYSRADYITAPTQRLAEELKGYGMKNVEPLPLGIEEKRLKTTKKDIALFRKKYIISPDSQMVLYTGRVSFEKKLEVLLNAFKLVENPKRKLLVIGGGPYLEKYKEMAKELGIRNVLFTGFVDDKMLAASYHACTVFVSPSDTETFGLTFVEAMAAGKPVLGVRRLGAAEVIANGKNGYLVKPGNHDALAKKLEKLLTSSKLRSKLGEYGKQTARHYSMKECTKRTLLVYKTLVAKKAKV